MHPFESAFPFTQYCQLHYFLLSLCLPLYIQGAGKRFWFFVCYFLEQFRLCELHTYSLWLIFGLQWSVRGSTAASIVLAFLSCLLHTSLLRPLKIFVFPTCKLLLYIFLCLGPFLASRNIPPWPEKQEGSWRIAHQIEKLWRHLFSVPACWHLSPAGLEAGVLKQLILLSEWYSRLDTK